MSNLRKILLKQNKRLTQYIHCLPEVVNLSQLRLQQLRYGLLRAARELFPCQDFLRQILAQPTFLSLPLGADAAAMCASGVSGAVAGELGVVGGDASPDTSGPGMLLQQLMAAATQPSPVKAIFSKEELEVCLDIYIYF